MQEMKLKLEAAVRTTRTPMPLTCNLETAQAEPQICPSHHSRSVTLRKGDAFSIYAPLKSSQRKRTRGCYSKNMSCPLVEQLLLGLEHSFGTCFDKVSPFIPARDQRLREATTCELRSSNGLWCVPCLRVIPRYSLESFRFFTGTDGLVDT